MKSLFILIGKVGLEPTITSFDDGNRQAKLSVAFTEKGFTTTDGKEVPDRTEWYTVIVKNRNVSYVEKAIHKGDTIYVEGIFRKRTYEDSDKITRDVWELYADDIQFMRNPMLKEPQPEEQEVTRR